MSKVNVLCKVSADWRIAEWQEWNGKFAEVEWNGKSAKQNDEFAEWIGEFVEWNGKIAKRNDKFPKCNGEFAELNGKIANRMMNSWMK